MNSQRFSIALAVLALALLVGACGGRDDGRVTLDVWVRGTEGELLDELVPDFERVHPGTKVRVTAVPSDASHQKYLTAIAGGAAPDLALLGTTWTAEFAGTGALDVVPSDVDLTRFFPGSAATGMVGGRAYTVPWYVETRVLYYRTDIARRAGVSRPPRTWDELKAMARALQAKGRSRYGIYLSTSNWLEFMPFVWQAGGDVLENDRVVLDSPEAADAFGFYKSFFDERLAPTTLRADFQIVPAFVRGTHPMFFSGPWQMGVIREAAGAGFDGRWAVAPVPARRTSLSYVGGGNWAVFRSSPHREAAWAFVRWMSEARTQARWFEISSDLPANRAAWDLPALANEPRVQVFRQQLEHARSPSPSPRWEHFAHALETNLDSLLRGPSSGAVGARQLGVAVAAAAGQ